MNGVEQKLKYLRETKKLIKDSINENGGTITDATPFDEYSTQIKKVIENTVVPQSTLNDLVEYAKELL